jgi:hypothetical protein
MPATEPTSIKSEARKLVERLADNATWEDLAYEIYVRQCIEAGREDARAGRVFSAVEARRMLGLPA